MENLATVNRFIEKYSLDIRDNCEENFIDACKNPDLNVAKFIFSTCPYLNIFAKDALALDNICRLNFIDHLQWFLTLDPRLMYQQTFGWKLRYASNPKFIKLIKRHIPHLNLDKCFSSALEGGSMKALHMLVKYGMKISNSEILNVYSQGTLEMVKWIINYDDQLFILRKSYFYSNKNMDVLKYLHGLTKACRCPDTTMKHYSIGADLICGAVKLGRMCPTHADGHYIEYSSYEKIVWLAEIGAPLEKIFNSLCKSNKFVNAEKFSQDYPDAVKYYYDVIAWVCTFNYLQMFNFLAAKFPVANDAQKLFRIACENNSHDVANRIYSLYTINITDENFTPYTY